METTKNWNLSDQIYWVESKSDRATQGKFFATHVKEFIRRLKDDLIGWVDHDHDDSNSIIMIVDSLAGEKLT